MLRPCGKRALNVSEAQVWRARGEGQGLRLRPDGKVEASDGRGKLGGLHSPVSVGNQVEAIHT